MVRKCFQRLLALCVGALGHLARKLFIVALRTSPLAKGLSIRINSADVLLLQALSVCAFKRNKSTSKGATLRS